MVVIGLPELLAGIVIDLVTDRPWLRLAAVLPADVAIETAALETGADVLLAMSRGPREDRAIMGALLERRPRLRAIALRDDGRSAAVYELQPRLTTYNDVSAARLVEATVERSDWSALLDPSEGEDRWP